MTDERKCKYHSDTAEKQILTFVFQLVLSMQVFADAPRQNGWSRAMWTMTDAETRGAA